MILSELGAVENVFNRADEYIQENEMRYFNSEFYSAHNKEIGEHCGVLNDRFSNDYLILSDEFIKLFEDYLNDGRGDVYCDPPEAHHAFAGSVRRWRPLLLAQARREMPLPRAWWPPAK